ncbi:hypothetical protein BCR44DRAFT_248771 [Catenaria anguillulae PL171]|uniref:Uncharacterized protein n=1 Tax=Catenaria anguillulae PL171 TaxID=765915 RepID=A0A1Y2HFG7_9FUNG|nr:hypothetical protein BCR44DRAFT_248771 [Catenaria anguillulae PL171]
MLTIACQQSHRLLLSMHQPAARPPTPTVLPAKRFLHRAANRINGTTSCKPPHQSQVAHRRTSWAALPARRLVCLLVAATVDVAVSAALSPLYSAVTTFTLL